MRLIVILLALLAACASERVIPPDLEQQIDTTTSFRDLHASPDSYRGRTVALSGEVLAARRRSEGTILEILQLPMRKWQPVPDPRASEGRFLAVHKDFLDPATVPPHTYVTIVGEVAGATTKGLEQMDYSYPELTVRHVKVWPDAQFAGRDRRPPWGVSFGGGAGGAGFGLGGGIGIGF